MYLLTQEFVEDAMCMSHRSQSALEFAGSRLNRVFVFPLASHGTHLFLALRSANLHNNPTTTMMLDSLYRMDHHILLHARNDIAQNSKGENRINRYADAGVSHKSRPDDP